MTARLGKGMAFPPRIVEGRFAWSADAASVTEAIRLILATEPTERVRLPAFGAGLGRLLFEPNTAATHQLIRGAIERALAAWEPRIRLEEVRVEPDPADRRRALRGRDRPRRHRGRAEHSRRDHGRKAAPPEHGG